MYVCFFSHLSILMASDASFSNFPLKVPLFLYCFLLIFNSYYICILCRNGYIPIYLVLWSRRDQSQAILSSEYIIEK